mgnify:CR=1 FL=1
MNTSPKPEARTVEDCELEIAYWKERLSELCNQAKGDVSLEEAVRNFCEAIERIK